MNPIPSRAGWPLLGLLAAALLATPTGPALAQAPQKGKAKVEDKKADDKKAEAKKTDKTKQIADIEKEIADLQKKLDELKNKPAVAPMPKTAEVEGMLPAGYVKQLNWRSIGPANMGGRVTAIAVVESDPTTYYVATASGGLLKTTNNGTTFTHLFDNQTTVSIGDVAVAPSDPKVVWVGTGESNPRNSVSYGDGVYKSTDAGQTFTHMGLKGSFSIGKIVIHPKDPNTVYVGAMGRVYGPNEERGLFKTTDGGKTWKKVLYVDDKTGVIDLRMDPSNPETLIAATWERKRDEFDGMFGTPRDWPAPEQYGPVVMYGKGGGLHKTTDGGKTWKKLTDEKHKNGLPTVPTGRIGLDYSRKTAGLLYAVIDTERLGYGAPPAPAPVVLGIGVKDQKGGGIVVNALTDDGPAAKAGLKEGDLILSIDGKKIADGEAYEEFRKTKKPGDVVKVVYKRGDKEQTAEVKVTGRAAEPRPPTGPQRLIPGGFSPEFDQRSQDTPVKVAYVPPAGPAAKAGVKVGMTVVAVDGQEVKNWRDFRNAVRAQPDFEDGRRAGEKLKVKFKEAEGDKTLEVELALAMAPVSVPTANPNRPYLLSQQTGGQRANVQAEQGAEGYQTGGVYVSKDNGETWTRVNSLNPRPFYFSQVRVDPTDDSVYLLGDVAPGRGNAAGLWRSTDGGKTFEISPSNRVHADLHAMWIDPKDGRHMILGCDGGFYQTYDRGENWDHLNVLALGQFYHVAVDNRRPYRVYGGLQDNGSWGGPSQVLRSSGSTNDDWVFVNGGDGFVCRVDPYDPDIVYSESQNGNMGRVNLRTGEQVRFRPSKPGEPMRYNWNTPFILSAHTPGGLYCAGQYVFRSLNRGSDFKPISADITRTKAGSGTALSESPRNADVLWAGTDDGFVWVTRDGGAKWENVTENIKAAGLPGYRWVATLEASRAADGRCYVAFDAHRSDDDKPYLFVTEDYGKTWKNVTANLPAFGSTRMLREDYVNPDLLYAGTEFGVFASVNRGASWTRINNNLPTVAVHEVAQPTTASEIVIATHGRSLWVLDVAALRQFSTRTEGEGAEAVTVDPMKDAVTLFAPAAAVQWKIEGGRGAGPYSQEARKFFGTNPYRGATVEFMLGQSAKEATLKVVDAANKTVWQVRGPTLTDAGFHRVNWNMRPSASGAGTGGGRGTGGRGAGGGGGGGGRGGFGGPPVAPGTYRVVLTVDGKEYIQPLVIEGDPNADARGQFVPTGEEDRRNEEEEEEMDRGALFRRLVPSIPRLVR